MAEALKKPDIDGLVRASIQASVERRNFMPALGFEKAFGLVGIGCLYEMPVGLSMDSIFDLAHKALFEESAEAQKLRLPEMVAVAMSLKKVDPSLLSIEIDTGNFHQVVDFLMGVGSGFNPDDINYFIHRLESGFSTKAQALDKRISLQFGYDDIVEWMPSPRTIDKINTQLDRLYGSCPVSRPVPNRPPALRP